MAALVNGICRRLVGGNFERFVPFLAQQSVIINNSRSNHFFKHLANDIETKPTEYEYEVSKDPKEWAHVERLLPLETVPPVKSKSAYPSGWRPPTDLAESHPYYVDRTKNHMLPVYMEYVKKKITIITKLRRIHGDIWKLHDELKAAIEEQVGKRIASYVHEGNNAIHFKGDYVYIVEQWLLSKGF